MSAEEGKMLAHLLLMILGKFTTNVVTDSVTKLIDRSSPVVHLPVIQSSNSLLELIISTFISLSYIVTNIMLHFAPLNINFHR